MTLSGKSDDNCNRVAYDGWTQTPTSKIIEFQAHCLALCIQEYILMTWDLMMSMRLHSTVTRNIIFIKVKGFFSFPFFPFFLSLHFFLRLLLLNFTYVIFFYKNICIAFLSRIILHVNLFIANSSRQYEGGQHSASVLKSTYNITF